MKNKFQKTLLALAFLLVANFVMAQAPQGIPYQAVARDNAGNLIKNQNIAVRFSIHDGTANGAVVFTETHSVTTDALGLFAVNIGGGTSTSTLANVNWGSGAKFTQVELDVTGGSNFIDMGTTQMMSVPYALYAGSSGNSSSVSMGAIGQTSSSNGATITNGVLSLTPADGNNVGIVTTEAQTFAGDKTFSGTTTASSFKRSGGTPSQILMADGSTTRTIRGRVNANGTIAAGSGFTVSNLIIGYGSYSINFTTPFTTVPIVVASPEFMLFCSINNITTHGFNLYTSNTSQLISSAFSFIAMAP